MIEKDGRRPARLACIDATQRFQGLLCNAVLCSSTGQATSCNESLGFGSSVDMATELERQSDY